MGYGGYRISGQLLPAAIKRNQWLQIAFLYKRYLHAGNDAGAEYSPCKSGKKQVDQKHLLWIVKTR
jgi:hypothetical protein